MSDTEDFATLFEASLKAKRVERGQTIEGTIVAIGPEVAFIDVGGKGEATIDVAELKDDEGDIEVAVGDRIQAVVVSTAGGLTLSRKLARGAASQRQLEDAFHSGLPVEGRVEKAVKGGYEVRVAGQRAFCPFSQIDTARTDPSQHEGKVYTFRITEYKEGGRNLVISRRTLLEEEQRATAAEVKKTIVTGAVISGRVASVREFGAFIDLGGGVQGLLHISEMGWSRVADPVGNAQAWRRDHGQGSAGRRSEREDLAWIEAAQRGSVVASGGNVRGRSGAHRSGHSGDGIRRLCRTGAWHRSVGTRIDVRSHRAIG